MFQKIRSFLFENTTTKQTVAKNTIWLSISNFGGRILKAVIVVYGARVLGAAGYGVFSYAVTLAGFCTLFVDPGINAILIRDASKASREEQSPIFSTSFVMKLCIFAASAIAILIAGPAFSTLPGAKALLPLVVLIIIFDGSREFFSSLIRANEKMELDAGIFLLTNLSIVVAGFFFFKIVISPTSFAWAYVAGCAAGALIATYAVRGYLKNIASSFSSRLVLPILRSAWPFAITGALGALLTNADILIISWMRAAADVGIYSAVIRIIQVLYLVPGIIQYSTLPLFARLANKDNAKFRASLERVVGTIFLISIPLALGGAVLGTQIVTLIFGPVYAAGGLSFKILMLTMLVDYPAAIVSSAIFAYDRQRNLIVSSAIAGVSNVVLDLLFIPPFGIAGSAVATLIAQVLSNAYLWYAMKKINNFSVMPGLKKIIIAGVIMTAATATLFSLGINVMVNIAVCAAFYFLLLAAFREPLFLEIKNILAPARAT